MLFLEARCHHLQQRRFAVSVSSNNCNNRNLICRDSSTEYFGKPCAVQFVLCICSNRAIRIKQRIAAWINIYSHGSNRDVQQQTNRRNKDACRPAWTCPEAVGAHCPQTGASGGSSRVTPMKKFV